MRAPDATPARPALPGLDPAWSRLLTVADADGERVLLMGIGSGLNASCLEIVW